MSSLLRRVSFAWVVVSTVGVFLACFLLWPLAETFAARSSTSKGDRRSPT